MQFSKTLLTWYLENKRDLPWRKTEQAYRIWLSEIMLQQTKIAQGLPYYNRFIEHFPTVFDLAKAPEEEVLKLWQGLGYYSRARNLHHTAKYIAEECNGVFPSSYKELKKLKGVGEYTAAAIASIAFNEAVAVVDGNVYRVLSRVFGIKTPKDSTEGKKEFKAVAEKLLDKQDPKHYNQAIMEFGALHCTPKKPLCTTCPLQNNCIAFQQNKVAVLPIKAKKTKVRNRYFNYLVLLENKNATTYTVLQQRYGKGIWQNLFEFPLIESKNSLTQEQLLKNTAFKELLEGSFNKLELFNATPIKHVLSHQRIYANFWVIYLENIPVANFKKPLKKLAVTEIEKFPVPVLVQNFIENFNFSN